MSDYTQSLMQLADGARTPAKAHIGQSTGWLDAYGQNQNKSWADYYDAYRKRFGGQQPEGYEGGGYGSIWGNQGNTSPGNTQYQWLLKQQQNEMEQKMNEYTNWMQNHFAVQQPAAPRTDPALMEYLAGLQDQLAQQQRPQPDLAGFASYLQQQINASKAGEISSDRRNANVFALADQMGISSEQISQILARDSYTPERIASMRGEAPGGASAPVATTPAQVYSTPPAQVAPMATTPAQVYSTPPAQVAPMATSGHRYTPQQIASRAQSIIAAVPNSSAGREAAVQAGAERGVSAHEIGAALGYSPSTVDRWLASR